jgi:MOSC domain-containing protein YiiM
MATPPAIEDTRSLSERLRDVPQVGTVEWIGLRPAHGEPMVTTHEVRAIATRGLEGDVAARGKVDGNRQITLVQAEHLAVVSSLLGGRVVDPEALRRNLVVSGINLLSLSKVQVQIGEEVVLSITGPCAPCGKMDTLLGPGGFQALRGHGGVTARVEKGGWIRIGARVRAVTGE